jgi:hypothetical protein
MNEVGTTSRDFAWGRLTTAVTERITGIGKELASVMVATEWVARHKEQCVADSFDPFCGASSL